MDIESSSGDVENSDCEDSPPPYNANVDENTNNTNDSMSKQSANSERTNIDALDDTARDTLINPPNDDSSSQSQKSSKRSNNANDRRVDLSEVLDFEGDDIDGEVDDDDDGEVDDDDDEEGAIDFDEDEEEKKKEQEKESKIKLNNGSKNNGDNDDDEEGELEDDEPEDPPPPPPQVETKKKAKVSQKGLEEGEFEDENQNQEKELKEKEEGEDEDDDEEELEEGEVTDDEDRHNRDPKPVCRFFSKGQCTWGNSCRFLHPGVTDKGLYTMFDPLRPLLPLPANPQSTTVKPGLLGICPPEYLPLVKQDEPIIETAWERGLRHAKEIIKQSNKRKETDVDFEEKKMNMSLAQEELDKENDYYVRKTSTPPPPSLDNDPIDESFEEPFESGGNEWAPIFPPSNTTSHSQKIDPDFVRERVHRINKPTRLREAPPRDGGYMPREAPRREVREAPPLHEPEVRMVRESELRRGSRFPPPPLENFEPRHPHPPPPHPHPPHFHSRRPYDDPRKAEEWHDPWMKTTTKSPAPRLSRKDSSISKRSSYSSGSSKSSSSSSSIKSRSSSRSSSNKSSKSSKSKSPSKSRKKRKSEEEIIRKAPPRQMSKPIRIAPPAPSNDFGRRPPPPYHERERMERSDRQDRPTRYAPPAPKPYIKDRMMNKDDPTKNLVRERDLQSRMRRDPPHRDRDMNMIRGDNNRERDNRGGGGERVNRGGERDRVGRNRPSWNNSRSRSPLSRSRSRSRSRSFARDRNWSRSRSRNSKSSRSKSRSLPRTRSKFSRDRSPRSRSRSRSSSSNNSYASSGSFPKAHRKRKGRSSVDDMPHQPEKMMRLEDKGMNDLPVQKIINKKPLDEIPHPPPPHKERQPPKSQIKLTLKQQISGLKANKNVIERLSDDFLDNDNDEEQKGEEEDLGPESPDRKEEISREIALLDEREGINSPNEGGDDLGSKTSKARRDELLKQLKAVEDAIAKKRSKMDPTKI